MKLTITLLLLAASVCFCVAAILAVDKALKLTNAGLALFTFANLLPRFTE